MQIMQFVDILAESTAYANRHFPNEEIRRTTKIRLCEHLKKSSGYSLTKNTYRYSSLLKDEKYLVILEERKSTLS